MHHKYTNDSYFDTYLQEVYTNVIRYFVIKITLSKFLHNRNLTMSISHELVTTK